MPAPFFIVMAANWQQPDRHMAAGIKKPAFAGFISGAVKAGFRGGYEEALCLSDPEQQ